MHRSRLLRISYYLGATLIMLALFCFANAGDIKIYEKNYRKAVKNSNSFEAYKWCNVLIESGDMKCIAERFELASKLTQDEISRAINEGISLIKKNPAASSLTLGSSRIACDVKNAQIVLISKNLDPGPTDGYWGSKTSIAVTSFQKQNTIPATGKLDERTCTALGVERKNYTSSDRLSQYIKKIMVADSITICKGSQCSVQGEVEFSTSQFGIGGGIPSGEIQIIIYRDIPQSQIASAKKGGVEVGKAYLMKDNFKFKFVSNVDLKLCDKGLARLFGISTIKP